MLVLLSATAPILTSKTVRLGAIKLIVKFHLIGQWLLCPTKIYKTESFEPMYKTIMGPNTRVHFALPLSPAQAACWFPTTLH